jgi:hypothetical protein
MVGGSVANNTNIKKTGMLALVALLIGGTPFLMMAVSSAGERQAWMRIGIFFLAASVLLVGVGAALLWK